MMFPTRLRPLLIIGLVNALAIIFIVGGILATRDGGHVPEPSPGDPTQVIPQPSPVDGFARVFLNEAAACRWLLEHPPSPVSQATAAADNAALGAQLMGSKDAYPGVRMVGLGKCADHWAVHIGVANTRVKVPAWGPGGTPVLARLALPFYAF